MEQHPWPSNAINVVRIDHSRPRCSSCCPVRSCCLLLVAWPLVCSQATTPGSMEGRRGVQRSDAATDAFCDVILALFFKLRSSRVAHADVVIAPISLLSFLVSLSLVLFQKMLACVSLVSFCPARSSLCADSCVWLPVLSLVHDSFAFALFILSPVLLSCLLTPLLLGNVGLHYDKGVA